MGMPIIKEVCRTCEGKKPEEGRPPCPRCNGSGEEPGRAEVQKHRREGVWEDINHPTHNQ
jgi:DnaJ-class molecular chaperone